MNDIIDDELVTIATFQDPAEASMARAAVEASGIVCFLQGETANTMIPVAFMAALQVRPTDEAAARAVLTEAQDAPESLEAVTLAEMANEGLPR